MQQSRLQAHFTPSYYTIFPSNLFYSRAREFIILGC